MMATKPKNTAFCSQGAKLQYHIVCVGCVAPAPTWVPSSDLFIKSRELLSIQTEMIVIALQMIVHLKS